jgi:hypothetical protein
MDWKIYLAVCSLCHLLLTWCAGVQVFSMSVGKRPMSHCNFWYWQYRSFDFCCHVFPYFSEIALSHNPYTAYSSLLSWNHYSKQLQKGEKIVWHIIDLLHYCFLQNTWEGCERSGSRAAWFQERDTCSNCCFPGDMLYLNLFKKWGGGGIWGYWMKTFIWCKSCNMFVCRLQPIFGC